MVLLVLLEATEIRFETLFAEDSGSILISLRIFLEVLSRSSNCCGFTIALRLLPIVFLLFYTPMEKDGVYG